MYIITSQDMPKEVFIEDVIERVIRLTKTQLYNAIYPEFDPVYRIDPHNKCKYLFDLYNKCKYLVDLYNKCKYLLTYVISVNTLFSQNNIVVSGRFSRDV